jgi:hypothetical protein
VVDKDLTHVPGGNSHELRAAFPVDVIALAHEA